MNTQTQKFGRIVTFYSYKGGTGRTMALANVACLLARKYLPENGRILIIDWDFEAPGLDRYFRPYLTDTAKNQFGNTPGCLDLFEELRQLQSNFLADDSLGNRKRAKELLAEIGFERFCLDTTLPGLQLLKAGRFDETYPRRVSQFPWEEFFLATQGIFNGFVDFLRERFDWVLVDSRTGVSDTSGICTMLLPDQLVVAFTPNNQSLKGVHDIVKKAVAYRRDSEDWRSLKIFPLPSRIDQSMPSLYEFWRRGNADTQQVPSKTLIEPADIGYQTLFESLFQELYGLDNCDLTDYFNAVNLPHVPAYAYGEPIAVELEKDATAMFLRGPYEKFLERLLELPSPWADLAKIRAKRELTRDQEELRNRIREKNPSATDLAFSLLERTPTDLESADYFGLLLDVVDQFSRGDQVAVEGLGAALDLLDRIVIRVLASFEVRPILILDLLLRTVSLYEYLSAFEPCIRLLEVAGSRLERELGGGHLQTLSVKDRLASILFYNLDQENKARLIWDEVLKIRDQVNGSRGPETITTAFNLYNALLKQNENKSAQQLFNDHLAWLLDADQSDLNGELRAIRSKLQPVPSKEAIRPYRLFVSYSHQSEAMKDRLLTNLAPLRRSGLIGIWDDRAISQGSVWRTQIEHEMARADAAIFLLDEHFLASDWFMDVELNSFLKRHSDEGCLILFVLGDYCAWEEIDYIKRFQILPKDGKPITASRVMSRAYSELAKEIKDVIRAHQAKRDIQFHAIKPFSLLQPTFEQGLAILLDKLPGATSRLFGRDAELAQISAWKAHNGVFLLVGNGGTGKSALVRKWLEKQDWPAGTRFLGQSFYSQGSRNQATCARGFLLVALRQLNVVHDGDAADDELGRLLAEDAAKAPTVLVLDGIEPLQQFAEDPKLNGTIKDRGLAALLEGLARKPGQALCLASSRLTIPETAIADAPYFKEKHLALLPPDGARELLRQRGVRGADTELDAMAERCGCHPLALVLAAEFCHTYLQDRAADFLAHPWQPKTGKETHAATVMAWFDNALAAEHQALDRELARILGLFDRPAPWGALLALKTASPIPGLTEALHDADEAAILESLARLSQWGLLEADLTRPEPEPELDAHPLVREHFGALLEQEDPPAWQAAHAVLFDWFRGLPDKDQPDTPEELEPLYRAVGHGCKAGCYRTALKVVYRDRILRGSQSYSVFQLGTYSADLTALVGFFPQGLNHPPVAAKAGLQGETLSEADRSWLLAAVAFFLASLGRLEEALEIRRIEQQRDKESENWINFCISSSNLTDLLTPLGFWAEAEAVSREAVSTAMRIADIWYINEALAKLGRVFHGQGRLDGALDSYRKAEAVQAQNSPEYPMLYSLANYGHTQLLLEKSAQAADWREVMERGQSALKISNHHLLSQAFDHCTIGLARAALGEADAGLELDLAVTTIQLAGTVILQPAMHLARANYLRHLPNLPAAWLDHDAAHAIAARGNMRTYLAECALLAGNLCLDEGRVPEAASQYATAAQLIREDGYGRRHTELHLLHARLLHAQHDPAAAPTLAAAEARIREVGQWYFWRELRAVAKEIGAPDPGECPQVECI